MYLARWSTLLLAAVLASPALWRAFVVQDLDYTSALTRFLIAVPVSAIMLALLRGMASGYRKLAPANEDRRAPAAPDASADDAP